MVDVAVKSEAAWVCHTDGRQLSDVVLPVHVGNLNSDVEDLVQSDIEDTESCGPVLLEQMEEGAPCVLTLCCRPESPAAIVHLLVVSEARNMEVYNQTGEYCGTARGAKTESVQTDSADRGPFYKKQLILECPSPSCELKLLSLAGRSSVLLSRVVVGVRLLPPCTERGKGGGSIDMQQVQSLVQEIGTDLSPGAKNLMDMVQFQQKNQTGSLGGFLPLLMGSGAFSALTRDVDVSSSAFRAHSRPANSTCEDAEDQDGGMSEGYTSSSSSSSPDQPLSDISSTDTVSIDNGGPTSHAHLTEMMSHFLKGPKQEFTCRPELLPMLQSVCGQVTQLRLDDAAQKRSSNVTWELLDAAMERRLEQMERRLKEHMDRRMDALQQRLEAILQVALTPNAERCVRATPTQDDTTTTTETHKPKSC
ncbi:ATPase PAAT isoform X2 [Gouania willdenowi]|uniref:ATPase PAAT isoform X2 n=1 Tax=Gouania willdenowi TaxID=441366 RepID=UPI001056D4F6|nr:uncharacterized protein C10orf88 homolog isoform X2 [Gouania willdenowi]